MNATQHINSLISKFLLGEASPEEAMLLEDWKDEHSENQTYFSSCEQIFKATKKAVFEPDSLAAWTKVKIQLETEIKIKSLYPRLSFVRVAATLAFIIGLGGAVYYFIKKNPSQELTYAAGTHAKEVKLTDGTTITISPNSSIEIDQNFGKSNRTIHLKGNATFAVVHQEKVPFIVDAGDLFIKDIGTKFNVRSSVDTDTVYVNVSEGVVLLFDSLGAELEIKATEKAIYIRSKKQIFNQTEAGKPNLKLTFSNTSLKDVIKKLNEIYHTTITLENSRLDECVITTKFDGENIETVLGIISETLGLSFEKTSSGYNIKGQGCQL